MKGCCLKQAHNAGELNVRGIVKCKLVLGAKNYSP